MLFVFCLFVVLFVDVPEVSVMISNQGPRSSDYIEEGDKITLECNVIRSNPPPSEFSWKNDKMIVVKKKMHVFDKITPEKSGNYTCEATNSVGSGTRNTFLQVRCKFHIPMCWKS